MNHVSERRRRLATAALALSLGVVGAARAAGPVVADSANAGQPAVQAENTAISGWGVFGHSERGTGVVGTSKTWHGVHGKSQEGVGTSGFSDTGTGMEAQSRTWYGIYAKSEKASGVHGTSTNGVGVEGQSVSWFGVYGATKNGAAAGAEFQNSGGGDLIRGGTNGAFRVANNGDVFVRGQIIGREGPRGPQGVPGPPGPPGPAVQTSAVCQSPEFGNAGCPCNGNTVTRVGGACQVTSQTGSCSNNRSNGCCAVCAP